MKANPKISGLQLAVALVLTVGAAWAFTPGRDAEPPKPTAAGARWACGEFLKQQHSGAVALADRRDWRVQLPKTEGGPWLVAAEYVIGHGGGASTMHRRVCVMTETADGWNIRAEDGRKVGRARVVTSGYGGEPCCRKFLRMEGDRPHRH